MIVFQIQTIKGETNKITLSLQEEKVLFGSYFDSQVEYYLPKKKKKTLLQNHSVGKSQLSQHISADKPQPLK